MAKYIQKRRRRWYAILEIPEGVRHHFQGRPRFVKSLETESESVAERRAALLVGAWKKDISEARGQPEENDAMYWRSVLKRAKSEKERSRIIEQIHEAAEIIGSVNVAEIGMDPTQDPEARKFYGEAVGWTVTTREHIEEWIASQRGLKDKTKAIYKSDVESFAAQFPNLADVTRASVRRWVTKLLSERDLSVKSVRRLLSPVRGYWRYLESINAVSEDQDPFAKLDFGKDDSNGGFLPLTPDQVCALMKSAAENDDQEMVDAIDVARWTGVRIEELCSIEVGQVHNFSTISIEDSKTEAGVRVVPVHPKLVRTLKRLIAGRGEGFLFQDMKSDKYGDRSPALGQRFSRFKSKLGYGPRLVFHSIRKTVATQFENAHVPEGVAADILGHEKPTMTYGVYSGGSSLDTKRKAILKLKYPE